MRKRRVLIVFLGAVFFSLAFLSTVEAHHGRVTLRDKHSQHGEVSRSRAIVVRTLLPILGVLDRGRFIIDDCECDNCDEPGGYFVNDGKLPYNPLDIQSFNSLYPYTPYPTVGVSTTDGEYHVGPPLGVPIQGFPYLGGWGSSGLSSGGSTPIVPTQGGKKSPYGNLPSTYPKPSQFPSAGSPIQSSPTQSSPTQTAPTQPSSSPTLSNAPSYGGGDRPASGPGSAEHITTKVPY